MLENIPKSRKIYLPEIHNYQDGTQDGCRELKMAKTPLVLESNPRFCGSMNVPESGELPSDMCNRYG